jgi:hypothetical protein
MAPMTRSRADNFGLTPTGLQAEYYSQRASAGLIVTEGTYVSPRATVSSTFRVSTPKTRWWVGTGSATLCTKRVAGSSASYGTSARCRTRSFR